ncbi:hypothetical protein FXO37_19088 [Capsicum annuum]|nr:hypothetical protein FXO37_19088 [Capsicum annuum]
MTIRGKEFQMKKKNGQLLTSGTSAGLKSMTLLPSPFTPPTLANHSRTTTTTRNFNMKMSIRATQASIVLPENRIIVGFFFTFLMELGCGAVSLDFLAAVASYPNPDDKIRSTSFEVQGGGNTGNALTCAARLGLTPKIISKEVMGSSIGNCLWQKCNVRLRTIHPCGGALPPIPHIAVADDSQGKGLLEELEADGVDSSFIVMSDGGNSPFTYIIVDNQTLLLFLLNTDQQVVFCIQANSKPKCLSSVPICNILLPTTTL